MKWCSFSKRTCPILSGIALIWMGFLSGSSTSCLAQSRLDETKEESPQAANLPFPTKPAYGRILNQPFIVDRAYLTYDTVFGSPGKPKRSLELTLRQGAMHPDNISNAPRIEINITFFRGDIASLPGTSIVVNPDRPIERTKNYPMITVSTNVVAKQGSPTYASDLNWPRTHKTYLVAGTKYGYSMRLSLGKMQGDRLPGYIILRVAGKEHTFVEGYFYATVRDAWPSFENLKPRGEFPSGN